jgi:hypothetical protein
MDQLKQRAAMCGRSSTQIGVAGLDRALDFSTPVKGLNKITAKKPAAEKPDAQAHHHR